MPKINMVQAINMALLQEMEKDDRVILLGEDIGVNGGVFRVTDGLYDKFGPQRVLDTPLAESAIAGFSIGMAIFGLRPVCEMQFSGFSYFAFHQMEAHASRMRGRSQGRYSVPMVLRAPYGGGVRALEHHSESREIYWAHTPGLKMVIPSSPRTARALMISAIRDPDPVIFYEPKALYRAFREEVPEEEETFPIGSSRIALEGDDITLISYGASLRWTLEAASELQAEDGIKCEVIDLLSLSPLDDELFIESVKKTGRAVVVHEAGCSYGAGAEVVARIVQGAFLYLEAPVRRATGFDIVIPLYQREQDYLPGVRRIKGAVRETLAF
ncbi:MAG TPA: alpha-ketoacid dehydrogenase subunit beta [Syntrophobacteraceae bacterium]|nr:alpha-ketoacid dehydrogenase subunit beta [Syntrophobacteraceae bacterium]